MSLRDAVVFFQADGVFETRYIFYFEDWFFYPTMSWDIREAEINFSDDEGKDFNLWTGKKDDTYIAPPYVPDRGWINLSGKECEPIYKLSFCVLNSNGELDGEKRKIFESDLNYRRNLIQKVVNAWKNITDNIQFWYDLEKITWNKKEKRYFHIDQCWFFGNLEFILDNEEQLKPSKMKKFITY